MIKMNIYYILKNLKEIEKKYANNNKNIIKLIILKRQIKQLEEKKQNKMTIDTITLLEFLKNVLNNYGKSYSFNKAINTPKDKKKEVYYYICDKDDSITNQYIQENIGFEGLTSIPFENAIILKDEKTTIVDNQLKLKKIFKENPIIDKALTQLIELIDNNKETSVNELMNQIIKNVEKKTKVKKR